MKRHVPNYKIELVILNMHVWKLNFLSKCNLSWLLRCNKIFIADFKKIRVTKFFFFNKSLFVKRCPWYSCHYRNGEIKLQNIGDKKDNPKEDDTWLKVSETAIFDARRNALLWASEQIFHCKWPYFQAYVYSVSLPNACYNKCTIT